MVANEGNEGEKNTIELKKETLDEKPEENLDHTK